MGKFLTQYDENRRQESLLMSNPCSCKGIVMSVCSPSIMKMGDDVYLPTAVLAEMFDEHGCSSVRVFSEEKVIA